MSPWEMAMAREQHFLEQIARFRERPKMGRYSRRQELAIWKKVHDLPDESLTGIVDHFLGACRFIPDLDVWDELVKRELRAIRERREEAEREDLAERVRKAEEDAAKLSPEETKRRMQEIKARMAAGIRSMED